MKFIRENLMPADILAGRNEDPQARGAILIRAILGSFTNHNALFVSCATGVKVGDTTPPKSRLVDLEDYERLCSAGLYTVRIWRVREMTSTERHAVSIVWKNHHVDIPYPGHSVKRLWVMRIVNDLPYEIQGRWCTKNTLEPFGRVLPPARDPRTDPGGRFKYNPTPRTLENRLVAGVLQDVTEQVIDAAG